ncbi:MAG: hypothetical protein JJT95_11495 [Pararhodobacter sp.]|nr:hypothetical protein [Pararhodobacter sp.]
MSVSAIRNPLSNQVQRRVDAFFASIGQGINGFAKALARQDEIEALYAKSDAQLAEMGLTRVDVPRHVFRDLLGS